jgi:hypothetical protein
VKAWPRVWCVWSELSGYGWVLEGTRKTKREAKRFIGVLASVSHVDRKFLIVKYEEKK